ncbi:glutamine synthetase family protein [Rhodococcus sp. IEGM 1379]|uniref:glutamine synthetase family protein n=1 Tax=Rhodococcus sp. IEGM 1379 TaxID=3047086 RepID=UPI0024B7081E|nr:glutamine synthetase family protein [Rhodococcus sp. IEGM 1379]MDI9913986.1 glutamine synthetase family protein [Rhodococcus sp. IEGM 1379]
MRSVDTRPLAGGGNGARPMLAADRGGFVDRHGLWTDKQYAAAAQIRRVMDEVGIELVRFAFVDQHGVLRGKTITRDAVPGVLRSGVTAPSSLMLKDTSGRSAFEVFSGETGVGVDGFSGAGDIVLVPDPSTFRVLPWAPRTGWILCDLRFPDGRPVPFCPRSILRGQLDRLAAHGFELTAGPELEFHVFKATDGAMTLERTNVPGAPGKPAEVEATSAGSQLLHEESLDTLDEVVQLLHDGLTRLDLPLRSIEMEFGPSQMEITLAPTDAMQTADNVVLARSAIRQICRRNGYHATFMAKPVGAAVASTGWHLHQSLRRLDNGTPVFPGGDGDSVLSSVGSHYLAGLLEHASAATAFSTPTVNGYKRYAPYSLAPDAIVWGLDNKGAMVRVVGRCGDPNTRLENRSGEPAANPYFYLAAQVISGLDGIVRGLHPGAPTNDPYEPGAQRLPRSLGAAIDALEADEVFRAALGTEVVEWYSTIKRAEFARYLGYVSDWEQREYFGLF